MGIVTLFQYFLISLTLPTRKDRLQNRRNVREVGNLRRKLAILEGKRIREFAKQNRIEKHFTTSLKRQSYDWWNPRNGVTLSLREAQKDRRGFATRYLNMTHEIHDIEEEIHQLEMYRISRRWR